MTHTEGKVAAGISDFPNRYNVFINTMEEDINLRGFFIADSNGISMVINKVFEKPNRIKDANTDG